MAPTTNPAVQARVPAKLQRLAKAKAALMGIGYGEYLAQLIEKDTIDILRPNDETKSKTG